MTTVLLLLAGDPDAIARAVGTWPADGATEVWVGTRADDDPLAQTAYGARWPYGGFVTMELADDDPRALEDGVRRTLDALGGAIDRASSTIVIGETHRIIDGRTDVALVYVIHRRSELSVEEYQHHWLHRHGPLAKQLVPTSGYEQTHADHATTSSLAPVLGLADAGFDGNATCFFATRQGFVDMLTAREGSLEMSTIYEDELRFIDHARSLGALMRQARVGTVPR